MLDRTTIRRDPQAVKERLRERLADLTAIDTVVTLTDEAQRLQRCGDELRRERNALARRVAEARDDKARAALKARGRALNDEVAARERALHENQTALEQTELLIPNLPHPTVPSGRTSAENIEVRRWGTPRAFPFSPRPHWEVGAALGLDLERGVKMAGTRFYALQGQLARLELALITFMVDQHMARGYVPVIPPFLVNRQAMVGCGQLPKFADQLYHCPTDDLYLIPTAESALAALHRDEILPADSLPRRYVGISPCFRREAGAAGQDTRGILRVHQFHKVELFAYTSPEASDDEHERLTADAEHILHVLELPYRTIVLCAGDMGFAARKTYDLEVWLPGQGTYREISSCSTVADFQARRANIRYRPTPTATPVHVHMLNGSGLAVGRTMVAILENNQQADGSVEVPAALQPYMGSRTHLEATA